MLPGGRARRARALGRRDRTRRARRGSLGSGRRHAVASSRRGRAVALLRPRARKPGALPGLGAARAGGDRHRRRLSPDGDRAGAPAPDPPKPNAARRAGSGHADCESTSSLAKSCRERSPLASVRSIAGSWCIRTRPSWIPAVLTRAAWLLAERRGVAGRDGRLGAPHHASSAASAAGWRRRRDRSRAAPSWTRRGLGGLRRESPGAGPGRSGARTDRGSSPRGRAALETVLSSEEVYLVPREDGAVLIGSTLEHAGFRKEVTAGAIRRLLAAAARLCPEVTSARFVTAWAGLRPGTPDGWPLLGESGLEGLYLATGHFRNGILLAPVDLEIRGRSAHRPARAGAVPVLGRSVRRNAVRPLNPRVCRTFRRAPGDFRLEFRETIPARLLGRTFNAHEKRGLCRNPEIGRRAVELRPGGRSPLRGAVLPAQMGARAAAQAAREDLSAARLSPRDRLALSALRLGGPRPRSSPATPTGRS